MTNSRSFFLLLFVLLYALHAQAQQDSIKNYSLEFQVFAQASMSNESSQNLTFDYNLKRTLLIYKQHFFQNWTLCLAGDTYVKDGHENYQRTPYVKRAYLEYHHHDLSLSAGLLVMEQFKYQRQLWQLRYISKIFGNQFNYGENRNTGLLVKHHLSSRFSYDVALTSGYYTPIDKSSKIIN